MTLFGPFVTNEDLSKATFTLQANFADRIQVFSERMREKGYERKGKQLRSLHFFFSILLINNRKSSANLNQSVIRCQTKASAYKMLVHSPQVVMRRCSAALQEQDYRLKKNRGDVSSTMPGETQTNSLCFVW